MKLFNIFTVQNLLDWHQCSFVDSNQILMKKKCYKSQEINSVARKETISPKLVCTTKLKNISCGCNKWNSRRKNKQNILMLSQKYVDNLAFLPSLLFMFHKNLPNSTNNAHFMNEHCTTKGKNEKRGSNSTKSKM